jgi:hypothetical protein
MRTVDCSVSSCTYMSIEIYIACAKPEGMPKTVKQHELELVFWRKKIGAEKHHTYHDGDMEWLFAREAVEKATA